MRLGKVEDVTDQVGDLFPPALHDTAGTVRSMTEVFALADSVILIDSTAIISEVKDMVPRLMMKDWAFGTPLEGHQRVSALVPADYHRLYNKLFLNRISALNALLPAAEISADLLRAHETVTPQSPALSSQVTGISHDLVGHVLGVTQLSTGWDGYHAKPIAGHTAEIAISLLNYVHARATAEGLLLQSPLVSPTPDGSIQLEWDHPDVFLTVEIPLREPISFYLERKDGEELGRDAASQEEVWEAIRSVCKS